MLTGLLLLLKKYVLSSTFYDISLNTVTLSKLCHKNQNYFPLFFLDGVKYDADKKLRPLPVINHLNIILF